MGGLDSKRVKGIDKNALKIIETLENAGFEAYIVGGCLRDVLLDIKPKDWDIATSALPSEVEKLFSHYRVLPTGLKYGTVSVMIESSAYEITTFRVEGGYVNARAPKSVRFTRSIEEDIKRRDFSINALYYAPRVGIVDRVGGIADLESRRITCVGNPSERFSEDALRIVRALRFSAILGFSIESHTLLAMKKCKHLLKRIAKERVGAEIVQIFNGKYVVNIFKQNADILAVILPELNALKGADYEAFLRYLAHLERYKDINALLILVRKNPPTNAILALALLGHFVINSGQKHDIEAMLGRLCVGNAIKKRVKTIINFAPFDLKSEVAMRLRLRDYGIEGVSDYLSFLCALGADKSAMSLTAKNAHKCQKLPHSLKDLAINGEDLLKLCIPRGPIIGEILENLLTEVIHHRVKNHKSVLCLKAEEMYAKMLKD